MSTTVEESAVEEVMGRIAADMGGALGMLLTALGTRSGLWAALAGAGPLTVDEVAGKVSVARPLVREWLASQAAAGYLTYDTATGTFTLPDAVAAAEKAKAQAEKENQPDLAARNTELLETYYRASKPYHESP